MFGSLFSGNPLKRFVRNVFDPKDSVIYGGENGYLWGSNSSSIKGMFDSGGFIGRGYHKFLNFGAEGGKAMGIETDQSKNKAEFEKTTAAAAADAAIRQAEFEASAKAGLERLAARRRKGYATSVIVDPGSTLGSTSTLGV